MTRINVVPIEELTDQHLFAEYREITRLFPLSLKANERGFKQDVYEYVLGTGHVKFFYDKLGFIEIRYFKLKEELLLRGYNITLKDDIVHYRKLIPDMYNDYVPTVEAIKLSRARIQEKLDKRPDFYTKYGKKIKDL